MHAKPRSDSVAPLPLPATPPLPAQLVPLLLSYAAGLAQAPMDALLLSRWRAALSAGGERAQGVVGGEGETWLGGKWLSVHTAPPAPRTPPHNPARAQAAARLRWPGGWRWCPHGSVGWLPWLPAPPPCCCAACRSAGWPISQRWCSSPHLVCEPCLCTSSPPPSPPSCVPLCASWAPCVPPCAPAQTASAPASTPCFAQYLLPLPASCTLHPPSHALIHPPCE